MTAKIAGGQEVTVAYTKSDDPAKQIQSSEGGVLESFGPLPASNGLSVLTPPVLTADTIDNEVGRAVDLTFTDNSAWRNAIPENGITVNDDVVDEGKYTITEGNINIAADLFPQPGEYSIAVKAVGYGAARVNQTMNSHLSGDTNPPVITLAGDAIINLSVGETYIEPGYSAVDDVDGDITANVVVGGDAVDSDTAGTYTLTYKVSDAAGNAAAAVTRTVIVSGGALALYAAQQGIGAFQLELTGVAAGDIGVLEATATYYSNVIKTPYNPSSVIYFDITITGSGGNGYPLETAENRVFPYIRVLNAARTDVIAEYNSGAGALKCEGTTVAPSGNGTTFKMALDANTLSPNTQYFLYLDSDLQNKQTTPVKFGKDIYFSFGTAAGSAGDTNPPVITLVGDAIINLSVGETYIEPGYSAVDDVDGNITANVVVGGDTVDSDTAGTYTLTYNVSDAAGNPAAEASRTVVVAAAVPSTPSWESDAELALSAVTGSGFNLSWPEAAGAQAYKVAVSNTTGGVASDAVNTTIEGSTSCSVTGLTAGLHYDIKVTAVNSAGDGSAGLSTFMVTAPGKPLFTFASGVPDSSSRYGFMPSGSMESETAYGKTYTYDGGLDPVNTRFLWYLQAGFNNTDARDHVDAYRLFNLTDNEEIVLDYGSADFGSGTGSWPASGVTETDTGYVLSNLITSGDFEVAKISAGSVWIRFELDIAEYLVAGKDYAITIGPQFHTGGKNPEVLGKVYRFEFSTTTPDSEPPAWEGGAVITVSDVSSDGFTVNYPAATDNVGVARYNVTLKADSGATISSSSTTALGKTFAGLDEGTRYIITIEAQDAAGNKSPALGASISTLKSIPTWAADARLTISNVMATDVTINWPYSNSPEAVAGYALYVNGAEVERFLPSDYYCELGGLFKSTRYLFELRPFNIYGEFGDAISATAVTAGGAPLDFTTTFAWEKVAGGEYYNNYVLKYPLDPDNFRLGWNFSNGIDKSLQSNLAGIRVYEKESGSEVALDKGTYPYPPDAEGALLAGDFIYTKSGGGDQGTGDAAKLRLLLFVPSPATLAGFSAGKDYVLEMQPDFISNNGENTLGKITTFTFTPAPEDSEPPIWPDGAALRADKTGPESVVLAWPDATDNLTLKEYRLIVNEAQPIILDAQGDTAYEITGLTPDTPYDISVIAVDAKNNQSAPLRLSVRTLLEDILAPVWPGGGKLTISNIAQDNVDLSWTAADDNVGVTGYMVYNGDVLLAETTLCQFHIIHLNPGTTYFFKIEAVDRAGNVSSTGPVGVIRTLDGVADTEAPQWNGGGSGIISTSYDLNKTYVTLQWPWATDNVAVKGYRVYLAGELIATLSDTANNYSGTLPSDGKYHDYEVFAFDAAGNISAVPQSFSVLAGRLPDDLVAPYWPAESEIIVSDFTPDTVVISWSAAQDNKAVQSYLLKRDQLWVVWLNQGEDYPGYFQFTDTERKIWYNLEKLCPLGLTYNHPRANLALIEGVPFSCSLKAYDAAGNSSMGGPKLTFYPGIDPTAGSGISFTLSNLKNSRGTLSSRSGAMNLVDNPTDPAGTMFVFDFDCKLPADFAEGISLYNKASGETMALDQDRFAYSENGDSSKLTLNLGVLAAETEYVIMFSKDFSSTAGTAIGFDLGWEFTTAKADREVPTWEEGAALEVAFVLSPTAATLSWPAAVDNLQVTQYKVFKDGQIVAVLPGYSRGYLAGDLNVDARYTFKVQAGDYLDNWSAPLEKTVTTPPASTTPPAWGTVDLTFTDVHSDNVTLNWSAAFGEYEVKEYLVYKGEEGEPLGVLGGDALSYIAGGLSGETEYAFRIVARDYSGNDSLPLTNKVTTAADNVNPVWPDHAFLGAKDLKSDSFTLYWIAATDNVGIGWYNIYQDGELIGSTTDGTITEYPVKGLEATTRYAFMVEAVDTSGNKSAENLVFAQSTTVSGPTEGAGIEFAMTSPANENVGKSGNTMFNRVTEPMLDTSVAFTFNFAKDLAASTWLSNVTLVKNGVSGNPVDLRAEHFSYAYKEGNGILKLDVPQQMVDMGASYQLILRSSFAAKDGSALNKDYVWEFTVAQGLYGIKDIAAGVNSYSAFERAADRFYLMVKSDGTVWGWGNNLYGHLGDGTTQDASVPVQALNLQNIVKVVAGVNSSFAIDADGGVWGWGSNEYGQLGQGVLPTGTSGRYGNETPQKIAGLPPIVKLTYGFNRCVALDTNGDVWTWGFRTGVYHSPYGVLSTGTPAKVPFLSDIRDVTAGWQTSLAVTADGRIVEWAGIDDIPAEVEGLTEVKSVACDSFNYTKNNLALKKDGTVWYWGEGTIVVTIPGPSNKLVVDLMQVEGAEGVSEIYTKGMALLTNDRSVRGVNVDFPSHTAFLGDVISNLTDISKLAVYTTSSRTNPVSGGLALKLDGTLVQFIADVVVPINPELNTVPPPVWPAESAITVSNLTEKGLTLNWNSCGDGISAYAVYRDGSLIKTLPGSTLSHSITGLTKGTEYTFKVEARLAGSSFTTQGPILTVTTESEWDPVIRGAGQVAAGVAHTLLIDADGSVWAWGANGSGQLGIGSAEDQTVPCRIDNLADIAAVAAGDAHSVALDGDGNVWVWGSNDKHQLGLGTTTNSDVPVRLESISDVKAISAAGNYNLAVKRDGTLWSWGEACNANLNYAISGIDGKTPGQMKYGTPSPAVNCYYADVKGAAASKNFYAVLFADGTISRSGYYIDGVGAKNYRTMLSDPGLMGVQAISAGDDFLMALLEDGTVAVLGDNSQGQYGNGTRSNPTPASPAAYTKVSSLHDATAISAGGAHGLALRGDGSIWGWGQNYQGQLGHGDTATHLIPVAAAGLAEIKAVDAGSLYSIVLADDAAASIGAYAFGANDRGQLGTGNTASSAMAKRILFAGYIDSEPPVFPAWFTIYVDWLSDHSARLIWTEATDNIGVTAYEVFLDGVKAGEVSGQEQSFTVSGLTPEQTYEFGIKAEDAAGNSNMAKVTATRVDKTAPTWSSAVLAATNINKTSLRLTWSGAADNVAIVGYRIYRGTEPLGFVAATSYDVTGLTAGTTYTFRVEAGDAAGNWSTNGPSTEVRTTAGDSSGSGEGPGTGDGSGSGTGTEGGLTVSFSVAGLNPQDTELWLDFSNGMDRNLDYSLSQIKVYEESSGKEVGFSHHYTKEGHTDTGDKVRRLELHFDNLKAGTTYVIELGEGVMANNGSTLGAAQRFEFTTSGTAAGGGDSQGAGNQGGTLNPESVAIVTPEVQAPSTQEPEHPVQLDDILGHWAQNSIQRLVGMGAINGYGDGTFLPDRGITRAEFVTVLVKALGLESDGSKTFTDTAGHWAERYIAIANALGIVAGYDADSFGPDDSITREQMAVIIVKAAKLSAPSASSADFADKDRISAWALEFVNTAFASQLISGYGDNTYQPRKGASRAEAVTVILRVLDKAA